MVLGMGRGRSLGFGLGLVLGMILGLSLSLGLVSGLVLGSVLGIWCVSVFGYGCGFGWGLTLSASMRANVNSFHARYAACASLVYAAKFLLISAVQSSPHIIISKRF